MAGEALGWLVRQVETPPKLTEYHFAEDAVPVRR
jgi:hypothetical protein